MQRRPPDPSSRYQSHFSDDTHCQRLLKKWIDRYAATRRPVEVNFSRLSPNHYIKDRVTHLVHSYPAKLIGQIPAFFIRALTRPGDLVLDPFCGSGTVLLEAILVGRTPLGAEVNPLARLISRVKTTALDGQRFLREAQSFVERIDMRRSSIEKLPPILRYWHAPVVLRQLSAIANALGSWDLSGVPNASAMRSLLQVSFSSIIRRKSLADPRVAPPVRLRLRKFERGSARWKHVRRLLAAKRRPDSLIVLWQAIQENGKRVDELRGLLGNKPSQVKLYTNAKHLGRARDIAADLVITSPPYMAAQKYTRSTSLELFWLRLLRDERQRARMERQVVGSERARLRRYQACPKTGQLDIDRIVEKLWSINRVRAKIVTNYFRDMKIVIGGIHRSLRPAGYLVLVLGNNVVCGRRVNVVKHLQKMAERQGFVTEALLFDRIRSHGLMTKRHESAGVITHEHILVMRKL